MTIVPLNGVELNREITSTKAGAFVVASTSYQPLHTRACACRSEPTLFEAANYAIVTGAPNEYPLDQRSEDVTSIDRRPI